MSKVNPKLYWDYQRSLFKMKHLKYEKKTTVSGKKYPLFNYMDKNTKSILDKMLRAIKKRGLTLHHIQIMFRDQTGMTKADFNRKFITGERQLATWELSLFMKVFDFDFQANDVHHKFYKFKIEKDRLIIKKTKTPKITINMNINDFYDYEADFSQYVFDSPSKRMAFDIFLNTLKQYFIVEAENKTLPFDEKKMRGNFIKKIYRDEIILRKTVDTDLL